MFTIEELQEKITHAIGELPVYHEPDGLYQPISYTLGLGGKRLRPLLALISTQLFGGKPEKALPAAIAIEIFHNFTLLHDDIIDQAPLRRGRETVYKKWDINTAILSGDTMFAIAYGELAKSDPEKLPALMKVFTKTAIEVCEGQQYDIDFEKSDDVNIESYINMIRLKTAVLLAASLKIGAIIAGVPEHYAEYIYSFGENIGIAFQLQDDLLDAFGNEALFGKKTGGDIVSNKKTFLYLKALECAGKNETEKLRSLYSNKSQDDHQKIAAVLDIFRQAGIEAYTNTAILEYYNKSMEFLSKLDIDEIALSPLLKLANGMLNRNH
ncbi:MAG: polyprenyl synthetase family protein [Bacteroidales bacterium]|nr:polyprenyl synthetase family protein [Bacteroidales bacterium]MBK9358096.1 polyprenyl synthetase family protein [Bacteroidales bacterium]